jgi:ATP-binding protein involved in chromosome partitioning
MPVITEEQVRAALATVKFPGLNRDIVNFGFVKAIHLGADNAVQVVLQVATRDTAVPLQIRAAAEEAVGALPGVGHVRVQLADLPPLPATPLPTMGGGPPRIAGVKYVVAVGSGKGGVGKSTVAVNLACALAGMNLKVGLLDADIYGPTVPKMLGGLVRPTVTGEMLDPVDRFGVRFMSMALLLDPGQAVIWRGPMISKAIEQFCRQVSWGELDVLLVDLPPGTGDAQLSLTQLIALDGAVIVTTPQEVAMEVVRRGLAMFAKVNVKVLGLVENMSHYACPHCGKADDIFGRGGARAETDRLAVPLLGEIPLNGEVRRCGDEGKPVTLALPESETAAAFRKCAAAVWQQLGGR